MGENKSINLLIHIGYGYLTLGIRASSHWQKISDPLGEISISYMNSHDGFLYSSPNPMFDSNKWSNIGLGEEIDVNEIKICTLSGALINYSHTHRHLQFSELLIRWLY